MTHAAVSPPRPFALACPDLSAERLGNTGTPGVWHFDTGEPGNKVMLSALIHGNELCGAWALKAFLASGLCPRRGTLTLAFCNLAAFDRFDPSDYLPSRFVDEDLNRVWSPDKLADPTTSERRRAAELRPWVDQADWLMDFHSMSTSDVPLQLTGMHQRNIDLALRLGNPANVIADAGHAAGVRMRDYGRHGAPDDNGTRALLIECGFHGAPESRDVALDQMARFLIEAETLDRADVPSGWLAADASRQQALRVTQAISSPSGRFRFARDWKGLESLAAGTLIGWEDGEPVVAPYDNCVLIMPSVANIRPGVTVLRLAQTIA
ncbi:succinylglutamate desuccinylase [Allopusillimonas soli]|uniref:Succinylglutamate desuccinylase/aspartoacylase family protein n=1 Tax=Allopusillimonas soli TaxID=659016 RepID=A0A853FFV2_9BURK|nr:succinylglutamate desuccinylase/aspartoacylase family protein [Allopusillimonas soli]NYT38552.1 succinylglutamate desuccinylase/aspartoacylase family protein [Allopusillimonas soli]TEA71733.1 succinylglutamate desuccinylase [Allopusillimonas soli]